MTPREVITPIQKWLLKEGKCSSCGEDLNSREKSKSHDHYMVTCSCSHEYAYYPKEDYYEKAYLTLRD